ncbi:MAG: hypothetical protein RIS25_503 [Actinomycetota bacterium]|jgi:hypothetical protein
MFIKIFTVFSLCISLAGCASATSADEAEAPERAHLSGYDNGLQIDEIGLRETEFGALGTIAEIGEETYFNADDGIAETEDFAVYFTPVRITTTDGTDDAPAEYWVVVHSDYSPKLDVSLLDVGDSIVIIGDDLSFDRGTGVMLHGFRYLAVIDESTNVANGIKEADEQAIDVDLFRDSFGLS